MRMRRRTCSRSCARACSSSMTNATRSCRIRTAARSSTGPRSPGRSSGSSMTAGTWASSGPRPWSTGRAFSRCWRALLDAFAGVGETPSMRVLVCGLSSALVFGACAFAAPSGAPQAQPPATRPAAAASGMPQTGLAAGTIEHVDSQTDDDEITIRNGEATMSAGEDDKVYEGDHVLTGKDQTVAIVLNDGSEIVVGPSSEFLVDKAYDEHARTTSLALAYGLIHSLVKKIYSAATPFVVETPSAVMGVRGTEFVVEQDPGTSEASVHTLEGSVAMGSNLQSLSNPSQSTMVAAGQASSIRRGMARPTPPQHFERQQYFNQLAQRHPRFVRHVRQRAFLRAHNQQWPKGKRGRGRKKQRPRRQPPLRRGNNWGKRG